MIVFYNKSTGNIVGTIDGRIHGQGHLNMWIGDATETDRIICQWSEVENAHGIAEYTPELQPEIFEAIDRNRSELDKYKVDTNTQTLVMR